MEQSIEIDCAPMTARPDAYIGEVIKDTGLPLRDPVSKCFGNWKWDYSDTPAATWKKANGKIASRLTALYNSGYIRYASW